MMRGSAVPTTVWSRAARNTPIITMRSTRIRTGCGTSMGGRSMNAAWAWVDDVTGDLLVSLSVDV